jgi:hypothetical protein
VFAEPFPARAVFVGFTVLAFSRHATISYNKTVIGCYHNQEELKNIIILCQYKGFH